MICGTATTICRCRCGCRCRCRCRCLCLCMCLCSPSHNGHDYTYTCVSRKQLITITLTLLGPKTINSVTSTFRTVSEAEIERDWMIWDERNADWAAMKGINSQLQSPKSALHTVRQWACQAQMESRRMFEELTTKSKLLSRESCTRLHGN